MGHLTIGRTMPLTFKVLGQNVKVIDCSECALSGYLSLLLKPGFGEFLTSFFFFYKNAQAVVSSIRPTGYIFGSCLLGLLSFVITPACACACMRTTEMPQLCSSPLARCVFHNIVSVCHVQSVPKLLANIICFFPAFHSFLRFRSEMFIYFLTERKKLQPRFCKQGENSYFKIMQGVAQVLL